MFQSIAYVFISIHAPAKGATLVKAETDRDTWISIHAPAKGATGGRGAAGGLVSDFNPRSREGSDKHWCAAYMQEADFNPRSREGSDGGTVAVSSVGCIFQSTLPRRERRLLGTGITSLTEISIHAPAKGATRRVF